MMTTADTPSREELLALADEYEAGTAKAVASGYEEFGPAFQRNRKMIVDSLRLAAKPADDGVREATDAMIEAYAKGCGEVSLVKNSFLWHEIRRGLNAALSTKAPKP